MKVLVFFLIAGAVLAVVLAVSRSREDRPRGDRFDWLPGDSAPRRFPVQVIRGDLYFENREPLYFPNRAVVQPGWGSIRSTHVVGETFKPLPKRLTITWFSFVEDCFYEGDFELPRDELLRLFRRGFIAPNTGEPATYHRIVVGMAPGGFVALWVSGSGLRKEVTQFRAAPVELPFTEVLANPDVTREQYIKMVLDDGPTAESAPRPGDSAAGVELYARLHQRSTWRVEVKGDVVPLSMRLTMVNGEAEYIELESAPDAPASRSTPLELRLYWQRPDGKRRSIHAAFDEDIALAAFRHAEGLTDNPSSLVLEVAGDKVSMRVEHPDLPPKELRPTSAKVYRAD